MKIIGKYLAFAVFNIFTTVKSTATKQVNAARYRFVAELFDE